MVRMHGHKRLQPHRMMRQQSNRERTAPFPSLVENRDPRRQFQAIAGKLLLPPGRRARCRRKDNPGQGARVRRSAPSSERPAAAPSWRRYFHKQVESGVCACTRATGRNHRRLRESWPGWLRSPTREAWFLAALSCADASSILRISTGEMFEPPPGEDGGDELPDAEVQIPVKNDMVSRR